MKIPSIFILTFLIFLIFSCSWAASTDEHQHFLECLANEFSNHTSISDVVYTPNNSSYTSILRFSIHNSRFLSNSTCKPLLIITPKQESQIPPVIHCAKRSGMQIRTRSGGHDLEGRSYASKVPFFIVDLINFSEIRVDTQKKAAWVGAGATLGALYYKIAEQSSTLGFPGGFCPTNGAGGHFSGGGYGALLRKYGLAADNVIDARMVDVNGKILNRKSMGEDLFWAIRGGGGASFGIILAWKVKLVDIPENVTIFTINKSLEQNATQLIHRWQNLAHKVDKDLLLFIRIYISKANSSQGGSNMTITASFSSMFLGGVDRLLPLIKESFPELGLRREDCIQMRWVQSVLYFFGLPIQPVESLLNRTEPVLRSFKTKADYVKKPIPVDGFEGIWKLVFEAEVNQALILMVPYGGRMSEISESSIPFPHRAGNLYKMSYSALWAEEDNQNSDRYINWTRKLQSYLTPYVSRSPRDTYYNYRDLDIGVNNNDGETSYAQASIWGLKYFKNNFNRLVRVKTMVDPGNFFRNEQSFPPLHSK